MPRGWMKISQCPDEVSKLPVIYSKRFCTYSRYGVVTNPEMPTWDNDNKEGQASKKGRKREEIQAPKIGRKSTEHTVRKACSSLLDDFLTKLNA